MPNNDWERDSARRRASEALRRGEADLLREERLSLRKTKRKERHLDARQIRRKEQRRGATSFERKNRELPAGVKLPGPLGPGAQKIWNRYLQCNGDVSRLPRGMVQRLSNAKVFGPVVSEAASLELHLRKRIKILLQRYSKEDGRRLVEIKRDGRGQVREASRNLQGAGIVDFGQYGELELFQVAECGVIGLHIRVQAIEELEQRLKNLKQQRKENRGKG